MIHLILSIISNIVALIKFKKTDEKVIENKKRELAQKHIDDQKKLIVKTHKTNDLTDIRKMLGD